MHPLHVRSGGALSIIALALFVVATDSASAQAQKVGDPPEASNMRLVGYEYPRPLSKA